MVDATEELFDIHDRMPVILHPDEHAWVNCPDEDALALVRKYPAGRLVVDRTEESWFKRKSNEGPTLICSANRAAVTQGTLHRQAVYRLSLSSVARRVGIACVSMCEFRCLMIYLKK